MIFFNAWITWVWLSFHDINWISTFSISEWLKLNENEKYRASKCRYNKLLAKKELQLFEINKVIIFGFLQRVYFLNLFSAIFVYIYDDTPCRNCSSIITINREKCQIIKSQCWRFQGGHKLWNSKRHEIP